MNYLLLIYTQEELWNGTPDDEQAKVFADHNAMQAKSRDDGTFRGAHRLMQTTSATSVRWTAGETRIIDGPFAETKEQLGGLYLIECDNLDQAIEYAKMIPHGDGSCVEIRPVAYSAEPG